MSKVSSAKNTFRLIDSIRQNQASADPVKVSQVFEPQMVQLRLWQADRMRTTYADLIQQRRFADACRFFIDEVQAPLDLTKLTQDLERMYDMSLQFLPANLLNPLAQAIELNTLTRRLDQTLLATYLEEIEARDVSAEFVISPEIYATAYRNSDNYDDRVKQIRLVVEVGKGIERVSRIPLVDVTLRLARNPAKQAGWAELQDFLERGLTAFKKMGWGSGRFLRTFEQREGLIVERIFAADPNPFRGNKRH